MLKLDIKSSLTTELDFNEGVDVLEDIILGEGEGELLIIILPIKKMDMHSINDSSNLFKLKNKSVIVISNGHKKIYFSRLKVNK